MKFFHSLALLCALSLFTCQGINNGSETAVFEQGSPEEAGLLTDRLSHVDARIKESIDKGEVAGTVAIIAREGVIGYHKAFGMADIENQVPMETSSLFRIASMSKLVTCVGALILFEQGHFRMDTKLGDILPEFEEMTVFKGWDVENSMFITEKAQNPIEIKHLFSHTSGIVYPLFTSVGREGYLEAAVQDAFPNMDITLEDNIRKLATLPLAHEPGEKWTYGMNMDVLGRIIEVVDGRPFARFMEEELFEPLGLKDTGFEVAEEDQDRVVQVYTTVNGELDIYDQDVFDVRTPNNHARWWTRDAEKIALGGGGIISTAYDYARFLQMLVNDGELEGTRILGRKTVELISRPLFSDFGGAGESMGLSVWVAAAPEDAYSQYSIGSYGWGGYFYTSYWVDPKEELVAVIMNQVNPAASTLNSDFATLTFSAIK